MDRVVRSPTLASPAWRVAVIESDDELSDLATRARRTLPIKDINHDAEWLAIGNRPGEAKFLTLVDEQDGDVVGQALFRVARRPLEFALRGVVLGKWPVPQYTLYQHPTTVRDDVRGAILACFERLPQALRRSAVVRLKGVLSGTPLHEVIVDRASRLHRSFYVLPWGKEGSHFYIRWQGSVEAYARSIGKKTRQNFSYYSKRLFADTSLAAEVKRYRPTDAEAFLRDVAEVWDKTWQRSEGVQELNAATSERIRFGGQRGSFYGYILYLRGLPAAFRYCFAFGGTLTFFQTGYDPAWAQQRVGTVLFFEVLKDFEALQLPVDRLDFLDQYTEFKAHAANEQRAIRDYVLFPRTVAGAFQFAAAAVFDGVGRAAAHARRALAIRHLR